MSVDIWGIGHCCQDNICVVEQYPREDGSTHILAMDDTQGGGAVGTAMVAASRLGARAGVIANLGDDPAGGRIQEGFRREGVNTELIRRIPGGRSSISYVMVNPSNGSRTKFPFRDQLPGLEMTEEIGNALAGARILHLDGTRYENAIKAARLAKDLGLTISLDACSMELENGKNWELASMAHILIANEKYPKGLTGQSSPEEALIRMAKRGLGPRMLAFTAGNRGCWYVKDGCVKHLPAFEIRAVDTTGAGDTFHGAFLACWLTRPEPEFCLRFASAAAALKCLKRGGRAGIPNRAEVEEFMERGWKCITFEEK